MGESLSDTDGFFRIDFDSSKFSRFLEAIDQTPDVYISVKDERGNTILNNEKTIVSQTQKEIEYHIRIAKHIPDTSGRDIYAGNMRNVIGIENTINLDFLRNGDLPRDIEVRLQNFVNGFDERNNNFDHFMVILSAVINM